jgi:hypothetical protein
MRRMKFYGKARLCGAAELLGLNHKYACLAHECTGDEAQKVGLNRDSEPLRSALQGAQERHQILLLLRGQFVAEHEVEELDCVVQRQQTLVTDNLMHDLETEHFFKPEMVNYAME